MVSKSTFFTWINLLSKSIGLVLMTPWIINNYSTQEVLVWYVFSTLTMLFLLFDLGFSPTSVRFFSFAYANKEKDEKAMISLEKIGINTQVENKLLLPTIDKIASKIYIYLGFISFFMMLVGASIYIYDDLLATNSFHTWLYCISIYICISLRLFANKYIAFLQGYGKYTYTQQILSITNILSVVFTTVLSSFVDDIVILVLVFNILNITFIPVVRKIYTKLKESHCENIDEASSQFVEIFDKFKSVSIKSGIGILTSTGLFQLISLYMAKMLPEQAATTYFISLQYIRGILTFSQAPFYSKLPTLNQLYQSNSSKLSTLALSSSKTVIYLSTAFSSAFAIIIYYHGFGFHFLEFVKHMDLSFWLVISIAFIIERQSAILIQIYSVTNHIIWHKLNFATSSILFLFFILSLEKYQIYSLPYAILFAYTLIYLPISFFYAKKIVDIKLNNLPYFCLLLLYLIKVTLT